MMLDEPFMLGENVMVTHLIGAQAAIFLAKVVGRAPLGFGDYRYDVRTASGDIFANLPPAELQAFAGNQ